MGNKMKVLYQDVKDTAMQEAADAELSAFTDDGFKVWYLHHRYDGHDHISSRIVYMVKLAKGKKLDDVAFAEFSFNELKSLVLGVLEAALGEMAERNDRAFTAHLDDLINRVNERDDD